MNKELHLHIVVQNGQQALTKRVADLDAKMETLSTQCPSNYDDAFLKLRESLTEWTLEIDSKVSPLAAHSPSLPKDVNFTEVLS